MTQYISTGFNFNATTLFLNISGVDYELETMTKITVAPSPLKKSVMTSKNRIFSLINTSGSMAPQEITIELSCFSENSFNVLFIDAFSKDKKINFKAIDSSTQNTLSLDDCILTESPFQTTIEESETEKTITLNLQSGNKLFYNGKALY